LRHNIRHRSFNIPLKVIYNPFSVKFHCTSQSQPSRSPFFTILASERQVSPPVEPLAATEHRALNFIVLFTDLDYSNRSSLPFRASVRRQLGFEALFRVGVLELIGVDSIL
jgi:hypothetical protein